MDHVVGNSIIMVVPGGSTCCYTKNKLRCGLMCQIVVCVCVGGGGGGGGAVNKLCGHCCTLSVNSLKCN